MNTFTKTQEMKAYEQQKRIADTMVSFREARKMLEEVVKEYDEYALQAMELNQDVFADELIETAAEMEAFADDFKYIELKLKTTAITARTLSKLNDLPKAIASCKKFVYDIPDLKKLGKDMNELRNALASGKRQFSELRKSFGSEKDKVLSEWYNENKSSTADTKRVQDKKAALLNELARRQEAKKVAPMEADNAVNAEDVAKIDAIAKIIDDEKNRE